MLGPRFKSIFCGVAQRLPIFRFCSTEQLAAMRDGAQDCSIVVLSSTTELHLHVLMSRNEDHLGLFARSVVYWLYSLFIEFILYQWMYARHIPCTMQALTSD